MNVPMTEVARRALVDTHRVADQLDCGAFESFAQAIAGTKTIALHGLGRRVADERARDAALSSRARWAFGGGDDDADHRHRPARVISPPSPPS